MAWKPWERVISACKIPQELSAYYEPLFKESAKFRRQKDCGKIIKMLHEYKRELETGEKNDNTMAMTKKQRSLAAQKAARTRKRNMAAKKTTRRRRPKKKGMLSAMTGAEGRNAFRSMVSGAVGGGLYLVYEDQVDLGTGSTPEKKGALAVLGAYVLATMGKRPNMAAGITGAAAYDFFKEKGLLNDPGAVQMGRMQYADPLSNIPVSLNDDQMYLAQGGDPMYLQDDMYLQAGQHMGAAGAFGDGQYLPDYYATYRY